MENKPSKKSAKNQLLTLYATQTGLVAGLFLGLFVFSSLFRVLLDILFGYGDNGPAWINLVIIVATLIITALCIFYSNKWINTYLSKRKIKKPFNFFPELSAYIVPIIFLFFAGRNSLMNSTVLQSIWNYWVIGGFLILVAVITVRSSRQEEKRFITVFYFGFISGVVVWTLDIFTEIASEVLLSNIFILSVDIFLAGLLAGSIGTACSFIVHTISKK